MLRRLLSITATLILVFGLLIAAMRGIGYAKPLPPALAEFQSENCPLLSCWRGIRLGTKNEEVLKLLSNDKNILVAQFPIYENICWWQNGWSDLGYDIKKMSCYYEYYDERGASFRLSYQNNDLRLGDVIALLGMPIYASHCTRQGIGLQGTGSIGSVHFWNASIRRSIIITIDIANLQELLSPDSKVKSTFFYEKKEETPPDYIPLPPQWPGFVQWKDISVICG